MALYSTELDRAIAKIKKEKSTTVCLQLPDGMKPYAKDIAAEVEEKTDARVLIWLGSNFGACDIPLGLERLGVDLLISWGHTKFHKKQEGW